MTYRHDLVQNYQPKWLNGQTVGTGRRDTAVRYQAIAGRLEGRSGFTVVDIGAHSGYFSLRLADEFNATATAVDGNPELPEYLAEAAHPRVKMVNKHVSRRQLRGLGTFDVGLCLSVLHHVEWWKLMLADLVQQCSTLFVELAVPEEAINKNADTLAEQIEAVEKLGGEVICRVPGFDGRFERPTYVINQ